VASQPINESGQSQEVPKVPGAPSMYFKIFLLVHRAQNFQFRHLMTAEGQLLRRKSRFSVIARTGAESDIYDCLVSILGQAWLTAPSLKMSSGPTDATAETIALLLFEFLATPAPKGAHVSLSKLSSTGRRQLYISDSGSCVKRLLSLNSRQPKTGALPQKDIRTRWYDYRCTTVPSQYNLPVIKGSTTISRAL